MCFVGIPILDGRFATGTGKLLEALLFNQKAGQAEDCEADQHHSANQPLRRACEEEVESEADDR